MCIRDRLDIDSSLAARKELAQELDCPDELMADSAKMNVWPVSYTHLRAHETVLDLVCRLLLEKKKQQVMYSVYSSQTTKMVYTVVSLGRAERAIRAGEP